MAYTNDEALIRIHRPLGAVVPEALQVYCILNPLRQLESQDCTRLLKEFLALDSPSAIWVDEPLSNDVQHSLELACKRFESVAVLSEAVASVQRSKTYCLEARATAMSVIDGLRDPIEEAAKLEMLFRIALTEEEESLIFSNRDYKSIWNVLRESTRMIFPLKKLCYIADQYDHIPLHAQGQYRERVCETFVELVEDLDNPHYRP